MAAYLLSLYNQPADAQAFDKYLWETHVPLAQRIPNLRSLETNAGSIVSADGSETFHRIGVLKFDSMEALQEALASPEGQETASDLPKFATGGVTLVMFEAQDILPS